MMTKNKVFVIMIVLISLMTLTSAFAADANPFANITSGIISQVGGAISGTVGGLVQGGANVFFGLNTNSSAVNALQSAGLGYLGYMYKVDELNKNYEAYKNQTGTGLVKYISITGFTWQDAKDKGFILGKENLIEDYDLIGAVLLPIQKLEIPITNPKDNPKTGEYDTILKVNYDKSQYEQNQGMQGFDAEKGDSIDSQFVKITADNISIGEVKHDTENFKIMINSMQPSLLTEQDKNRYSLECVLGNQTGNTGKTAKPKISYDWKYSNITANYCDANKTDTYCDSTQFLISVIDRLNEIKEIFNAPTDTEVKLPVLEGGSELSLLLRDSNSADKTALLNLLHFKVNLMRDGFTKDFFNDFDYYYRSIAFAQTKTNYTDPEKGYWKYITSAPDNFKIVSQDNQEAEEYLLDEPGIYQADIIIEFPVQAKTADIFFKDDVNVSTKISVVLSKTADALPYSLFYLLPIDGLIGIDPTTSEPKRIGYGTNFEGEIINVSQSGESIKTISSKQGQARITLKVKTESDFQKVNSMMDSRGRLAQLEFDEASNTMNLIYSPNYANPVIINIKKENKGNAFAFYNVAITNSDKVETGGSTNITSNWLTEWVGAGLKCKWFTGEWANEKFNPALDMRGIASDCATPREAVELTGTFGIEECGIQDSTYLGNAFLKTIFFIPDNYLGVLKTSASSDSARFIVPATNDVKYTDAEMVSFNGSSSVNAISGLLDGISESKFCIGGSDSKQNIFWNPQSIWTKLADIENKLSDSASGITINGKANQSCIK